MEHDERWYDIIYQMRRRFYVRYKSIPNTIHLDFSTYTKIKNLNINLVHPTGKPETLFGMEIHIVEGDKELVKVGIME